ncbi:superoxide dismutase family protein [Gimesia sp.]|uniref:superoxide dismutase family protein n=1 Tax=Gimesia sp. TaxID=2024833 RepID=UPI003A91467D
MLRYTLPLLLLVLFTSGCTEQPNNPNEVANEAQTQTQMGEEGQLTPDASGEMAEITKAVCKLQPIGDSQVSGTIHFTKEGNQIHVQGEITGLKPGKHGFHVHEKGDLSDKETGKSAGGHFNPAEKPHGKPGDSQRHVGDLGNIEANADGIAKVEIVDEVIQLNGKNSIIGRSIVVHAGEDQFTQPSGDAGDRVAFGDIVAEKTD